ncbi:hypothetical protein [Cellulomonas fimi]|uniref:Uncharacterized protein n=1 Tax=Cellulomonas fimi (strain ATCC 484 / DSM 20113 / JCM 1341 / CCUG 24087 / LMG 16345 / NBRC 15513 / NCIMB 8980 / NCTC 7547 / NRS-133) TaxID=590998 RepID=F4H256_CELFA|nr:hypothetical protein [Cellulomonas fimi]AEE46353.1 hypothetical protein Celf_2225 [Cellulomonas fimi ATCC 484]NNH07153.1 hypothetical protein [Cellulomonas fimi]VEH32647.1 Uncharacterised protein [Cellulomonas fimi]
MERSERARDRRFVVRLVAVLACVLVVLLLLVVRSAHEACMTAELSLLDATMDRADICRARWTPRRWADLAGLAGVGAAGLALLGTLVVGVRRRSRRRRAGRVVR